MTSSSQSSTSWVPVYRWYPPLLFPWMQPRGCCFVAPVVPRMLSFLPDSHRGDQEHTSSLWSIGVIVHSFTYPSTIHPSAHPSIHHPPIYLSIHPLTHPSTHPPIHLSIHPSIHLSIHPSTHHLSTHSPVHPFTHPSVHPPISLSTTTFYQPTASIHPCPLSILSSFLVIADPKYFTKC